MKKDIKLYNLFIPFYVILFFSPGVAVFTLLGNLIIDSIVLLIISKAIYKKLIGGFYLKNIWKIWLLGFLSDVLGIIYLFILDGVLSPYYSQHIHEKTILGNISRGINSAVNGSAFLNIWSFLFRISAIIISGILIFVFNYFISFRKSEMTKKQKILSSLAYAVFTAPYTILFF